MRKLIRFLFLLVTVLIFSPAAEGQETARGYFVANDCGTIFGPATNRIICFQLETLGGRNVGVEYKWNGSAWVIWNDGSGGGGSGGGSQHQINGVNITLNDPINFQNSASIAFSNPSLGNIQAVPILQSGSGLSIGAGLSLLRTCADQEIMKWTAGTSTWSCAADTTGGTPAWNTIANPAGNLSLAMAAHTTLWTWGNATGSADLFSVTDTASNSGTGYLARFFTATGSSVKPFMATAQGTANGVEMTSTGTLQPIGSGTIITSFSSLTGNATNGQLPSTLSSKTFDNTNVWNVKDSFLTLQDDGDATKQSRFDLANLTTATTRVWQGPNASTRLLGDSDFSGSHAGTLTRTGAAAYATIRNNLASATDPAPTDDSSANYGAGSFWFNTTGGKVWVAQSVGVGAAVWRLLYPSASSDTLDLVSDRGATTTGRTCSSPFVIEGNTVGTHVKICDDPTLGLYVDFVVGGVLGAVNKRVYLNSGFDWCIAKRSDQSCLMKMTEAGVLTFPGIGTEAQGDVLYYAGATGWKRLGAGTTGQVLKTQGAAANPAWGSGAVLTARDLGSNVTCTAPGDTTFLGIFGGGGSTEANLSTPMPHAGVVNNLHVKTVAIPAGQTLVVTIRKGGVDTTSTCTIAAAGTTCSDTTHAVSFAAADLLTVKTVCSGGTTALTAINLSMSY